jgi:transposase
MLAERIEVDNIYMVLGYTDMRKSITGLAAIVKYQFKLNPFERSLFLFCGKRADRMKALLWEEDGFLLLYKIWKKAATNAEERGGGTEITFQEYHRLLEGLQVNSAACMRQKSGDDTEM